MLVRSPLRWTLPVAVLVALLLFGRWRGGMFDWTFVDLAVYRDAGAAVLRGGGLYANADGTLPFTYPPFAGLAFTPLGVLDLNHAAVLMTAVSVAALGLVMHLCGRSIGLRRDWLVPLTVLGLVLEPVWLTFRYGQINLVLTALVFLDCLVLPRRYRGVLTGIAAGIKLTPAVFVLWFILRRDWRAAGTAALSGAGTMLLGVAVQPAGSWQFWTTLWHDAGRVGGLAYGDNQSLYGILARAQHTLHPAELLVLTADVAVLTLAVVSARRQLAAGETLASLTVVGIAGLLISPISWSHHWTWIIPALFVLVQRRSWFGLAVLAAAGYSGLQFLPPTSHGVELQSSWWQQLCYANLPIAGSIFLLLMLRIPQPVGNGEELVEPPRAAVAEPI